MASSSQHQPSVLKLVAFCENGLSGKQNACNCSSSSTKGMREDADGKKWCPVKISINIFCNNLKKTLEIRRTSKWSSRNAEKMQKIGLWWISLYSSDWKKLEAGKKCVVLRKQLFQSKRDKSRCEMFTKLKY